MRGIETLLIAVVALGLIAPVATADANRAPNADELLDSFAERLGLGLDDGLAPRQSQDVAYAARPFTFGPVCTGIVGILLTQTQPTVETGPATGGGLCGIGSIPLHAGITISATDGRGLAYGDGAVMHGDGSIWRIQEFHTSVPHGGVATFQFGNLWFVVFGADKGTMATA